jgi:hypothetical protein
VNLSVVSTAGEVAVRASAETTNVVAQMTTAPVRDVIGRFGIGMGSMITSRVAPTRGGPGIERRQH